MAQRDYKALLEKMLTGFLLEEDPLKAMLEWLAEELMRVEAETKVGAAKGKHSQERKRSEAALISLVQEAFVNGVSTRKIERLARSLGIESISASQVSEITQGLDERVEEFRSRALREEYPFLWIDALYEKVRVEGKVESVAVMVA